MPGRRHCGTLRSIRRGNNSSAHVNQEFRTPLILRVLRCGILGLAMQLMKWASASIARRCWPRRGLTEASPTLSTFCSVSDDRSAAVGRRVTASLVMLSGAAAHSGRSAGFLLPYSRALL